MTTCSNASILGGSSYLFSPVSFAIAFYLMAELMGDIFLSNIIFKFLRRKPFTNPVLWIFVFERRDESIFQL